MMCPACKNNIRTDPCPHCNFSPSLIKDRDRLIDYVNDELKEYLEITDLKERCETCVRMILYISTIREEEVNRLDQDLLKLVLNNFFRITQKFPDWPFIKRETIVNLLSEDNRQKLIDKIRMVRQSKSIDPEQILSTSEEEKPIRPKSTGRARVDEIPLDPETADIVKQKKVRRYAKKTKPVQKTVDHPKREEKEDENEEYDGYYDTVKPKDYGSVHFESRYLKKKVPWSYILAIVMLTAGAIGCFVFPFIN